MFVGSFDRLILAKQIHSLILQPESVYVAIFVNSTKENLGEFVMSINNLNCVLRVCG